MKVIFRLTLTIFVSGFLLASAYAEERTWKNTAGKTMSGSLSGFTTSGVNIVVGGKRVEIPLKDLSKADVDYIEKRRSKWPLKLDAKTVKITSNQNGGKWDRRQLQVDLKDVAGRELKTRVVWIGDGGNSSNYGKFKTVTEKMKVDGTTMFKIAYNRKGKFSKNYRGYAVQVTNAEGDVLAETASQVPFIRFLAIKK